VPNGPGALFERPPIIICVTAFHLVGGGGSAPEEALGKRQSRFGHRCATLFSIGLSTEEDSARSTALVPSLTQSKWLWASSS
jgi:hypothetical protein